MLVSVLSNTRCLRPGPRRGPRRVRALLQVGLRADLADLERVLQHQDRVNLHSFGKSINDKTKKLKNEFYFIFVKSLHRSSTINNTILPCTSRLILSLVLILVFLFHGSTEKSMKIFYSALKCNSYCVLTCSDVKMSPPLLVISTTFLSMYW